MPTPDAAPRPGGAPTEYKALPALHAVCSRCGATVSATVWGAVGCDVARIVAPCDCKAPIHAWPSGVAPEARAEPTDLLNIPGATKLEPSDWRDLLHDAADAYNRDSGISGYTCATSSDLRALGDWMASFSSSRAEPSETTREDTRPVPLRTLATWHEDDGPVLWWAMHNGKPYEPPYCGTPLDSDWPGYHKHWTPLPHVMLLSPEPTNAE